MNKRESLETTANLWRWLQQSPKKDKKDWPGWKHHNPGENYCTLCNYALEGHIRRMKAGTSRRQESYCRFCPLYKAWMPPEEYKNLDLTPMDTPCCEEGSPYTVWVQSGRFPDIRSLAAGEIVKLCEKELKKLDKKESGQPKPLPYIEFEGQR